MPRKVIPLNDIAVKSTKPQTVNVKLFDGGGLFLLVTPSGGKLWRLKYRFGGTEKLLTLGAYPQTTLADARKKRTEARSLLDKGIDPGAIKKAQKAADTEETETFEVIAREWHDKFSPTWAASHADKILRRLDLYIFPWLGSKPIRSITAPELLACLRRLEEKGTLDTAHRAKQNCGQVFRYAIATGRAERDPYTRSCAAHFRLSRSNITRRLPTLNRLAHSYGRLMATKGGFVTLCALKLAPLLLLAAR